MQNGDGKFAPLGSFGQTEDFLSLQMVRRSDGERYFSPDEPCRPIAAGVRFGKLEDRDGVFLWKIRHA